jgi:hypothetical protein
LKTLVAYSLLVLILLSAGVALLLTGRAEQRLIEGRRQLLLMQRLHAGDAGMREPSPSGAVLPWLTGRSGEAREQLAADDYWQRNYAAVRPERDASGTIVEQDPALLLIAANAAFRAIRVDGSDPGAADRLANVLGEYADLLKRAPGEFDAAYNYELVSRTRDRLGRPNPARGSARGEKPAAAPPPEPTIHGRPGAPAAERDSSDFKIIIPKRGDERKQQPEAGSGGVKIRKG